MTDFDWTDEMTAHRETDVFEDAFQQGADDPRTDAEVGEPWTTGLIATDVDEQPEFEWRNPRISERTDLENGRQVYSILCDDGQDVELKAQITKLNKKLAKWDQTINILAEEEVLTEHWMFRGFSGREVTEEERAKGIKQKFDYNLGRLASRGVVRQVRLTIDSPAVAGKKTKLIGAFEAAEDGESVYRHALNGATEADIEPFLARWKDCDHCGFKRDRRASFVCEAEDGTRVVIGRQCSRDFLGLDAAELLAREAIRRVLSNGNEDPEEGGSWFGTRYIHVESLTLKAYIVAKRLGGYSRETSAKFRDHVAALEGAKDWGKSTHFKDLREEYKVWMEKARPEPMDFADFADYVYKATGDFGQNLQIAFGCEYAKPKRRNLIVAGVGVYIGRVLKDAKEASVKKDAPKPKFLDAEVGKRVVFEGVVETTIPLPSDFGPKTLVKIMGDDGTRCVHFCTGMVCPEAGNRYSIKATVKGHENKAFGPQTIITRAVYSDVVAPTLI